MTITADRAHVDPDHGSGARLSLVGRLTAIAGERESLIGFTCARMVRILMGCCRCEVMGALNAGGFSNIGLVTDIAQEAPRMRRVAVWLRSAPISLALGHVGLIGWLILGWGFQSRAAAV